MSKYTDIGVENKGHVGTDRNPRPPLNFFDISLINQIADALEEFDRDIEIRASVLAAQGKAFCAGANFSDPARQEAGSARPRPIRPPASARSTISTSRRCASSATRSRSSPPCMAPPSAAGWGLRSRRISASPAPRRASPRISPSSDFHPGFGLTATLPELVGKNNAELIFYTSRRVTGEEATRMGLANVCVPQDQVRAEAMKLAAEIAECSPLGLLSTRATMRAGLADRVHGRDQPRTRRTEHACAPPKISRKASRPRRSAGWRISRGGELLARFIRLVQAGTHTPPSPDAEVVCAADPLATRYAPPRLHGDGCSVRRDDG